MNEDKLRFLKTQLIPLLQKIPADRKPAWGKMNLQQMVEHLAAAFKIAAGTLKLPGEPNQDQIPRSYAFLMSEKPFKENLHNPFLSEDTYPLRNHTLAGSIGELQSAMLEFFTVYEQEPGKRTNNLIFGSLNYAEQVQLLHKHALHHLKQFGETPLAFA
jgi:hypothetical protein